MYVDTEAWTRDEAGVDNFCRVCADGGTVATCRRCNRAICQDCANSQWAHWGGWEHLHNLPVGCFICVELGANLNVTWTFINGGAVTQNVHRGRRAIALDCLDLQAHTTVARSSVSGHGLFIQFAEGCAVNVKKGTRVAAFVDAVCVSGASVELDELTITVKDRTGQFCVLPHDAGIWMREDRMFVWDAGSFGQRDGQRDVLPKWYRMNHARPGKANVKPIWKNSVMEFVTTKDISVPVGEAVELCFSYNCPDDKWDWDSKK
jgi:hypothetical protein